jgi:hypothetical protein
MKTIDHIYRIATIFMIIMLPASIILLGVSIYLDGNGFCISIFEAAGIFVCVMGGWMILILNAAIEVVKMYVKEDML